jgi:hypothetical protein
MSTVTERNTRLLAITVLKADRAQAVRALTYRITEILEGS